MKFVAALTLFICHCQLVRSQSAGGYKSDYTYKAALRFNFTGLTDPIDNNLSLGGEYVLNQQWSVVADIAWITHSVYFSYYKGLTGYMLRPGIRYYPSVKHRDFIDVIFLYKHINYHMEDWLGKDCVNGVAAYNQYQKFTYGKRVAGVNVQGGFQVSLSKNKLFRLEGYAGLGIRFISHHVVNQENACYSASSGIFDASTSNNSNVVPSLVLGMRVIYCIK